MNKRLQSGFTLIELLVVIAIIGLLSSVVLVSLGSAREKARNTKRLADARTIVNALELYYDAQSSPGYPSTTSALTTYLPLWPKYPSPADTGCSATDYTYSAAASSDYSLTFCLSQITGAFTPGTHTASKAGIQ